MENLIELDLTAEERQFLKREFELQKAKFATRDDAFREYFMRHRNTVLPKLETEGPIQITGSEAGFILFSLGGIFARARMENDEEAIKLHFQIMGKFDMFSEDGPAAAQN